MTPRQLAFISAALRHVEDAEHLLTSGSHRSEDQAWHLAGFGPECVRKACLEDRALDRALGHNLAADTEHLLEWGLSLDPHASRYGLVGWAGAPQLADWDPTHRYDRTGTHVGDPVAALVASARNLVHRVHADLWADGRITGRER